MVDILQIDIFKYIFLNEMMTEVNRSIIIINAYAADIPSLPTGVSHAPPQLYQGHILPIKEISYQCMVQHMWISVCNVQGVLIHSKNSISCYFNSLVC